MSLKAMVKVRVSGKQDAYRRKVLTGLKTIMLKRYLTMQKIHDRDRLAF